MNQAAGNNLRTSLLFNYFATFWYAAIETRVSVLSASESETKHNKPRERVRKPFGVRLAIISVSASLWDVCCKAHAVRSIWFTVDFVGIDCAFCSSQDGW